MHPADVPAPPPGWGPLARDMAGVTCLGLGFLLAAVSIFALAGLAALGLFVAAGLVALGAFLSYSPEPPV